MKEKINLLAFLVILLSFNGLAQIKNERFGSEYTFIGKGSSGNSENASFEKYDFTVSFPKRLKTSGATIFHKFNYSKTNIDYSNAPITDSEIENFHTLSYTFGFSRPLKNGWFLMAFVSPNISSNFESSINWDELNLFGMALFTKAINKKRNLFLGIGALYSNTLGFPTPIPVANLMWKPNKKWTLNFGFPKIDVNYQMSHSSIIGSNLFISGSNFTLSNDITVSGNNQKIDNIQIMNMGAGLYWHQNLTRKIKLKMNSGYTFYRNFEFDNGKNKVLKFDLDNNFFINAGISIGL